MNVNDRPDRHQTSMKQASNASFQTFDILRSSYSVDGKDPGPLLNAETSEVQFGWTSYYALKGVQFKDLRTYRNNIYHNILHNAQ